MAGSKREPEFKPGEHPSIYVGETSRSLKERAKEHWTGYIRKSEDNHMRNTRNYIMMVTIHQNSS